MVVVWCSGLTCELVKVQTGDPRMQKKMLDKQTVLLTIDFHYMDSDISHLLMFCRRNKIKFGIT